MIMRFYVNFIRISISVSILLLCLCDLCKAMQNVYRASKHASKKFSPSISAVLVECPKRSPPDCERKMMVNIRVDPSHEIEKVQQYLVLDEAFDQKRQTKAKLMSPYMIEITRGEPMLMYPLEFSKTLRCDPCHCPKENSPQDNENDSGFDSQNPLKKGDIKLVVNENPVAFKGHLTDENFMNIRDLIAKEQGSNQNNIQQKGTTVALAGGTEKEGEEIKALCCNSEGHCTPCSQISDKGTASSSGSSSSRGSNGGMANSITGSGNTNINDNSKNNIKKPPFIAKIHIGKFQGNGLSDKSENDKRKEAENAKNQRYIQELQQLEKTKKDIKDTNFRTNLLSDVRSKRLDENVALPIRSQVAAVNSETRCEECWNDCNGKGPCTKNCGKCSQTQGETGISSKRANDSKYSKQVRNSYEKRGHQSVGGGGGSIANDKKLTEKNDMPIQEVSADDESSNSDDEGEYQDDDESQSKNVEDEGNDESSPKVSNNKYDDWSDKFENSETSGRDSDGGVVGDSKSSGNSGSLSPNRIVDLDDTNKYSEYSWKQQYQQNIENEPSDKVAVNYKVNNDGDLDDMWNGRNSEWAKDSGDDKNSRSYNNGEEKSSINFGKGEMKTCKNCNANNNCKYSQTRRFYSDKKKKNIDLLSLKHLNSRESNDALNSIVNGVPALNPYQTLKVPLMPQSHSAQREISKNKHQNRFPFERSPSGVNEKKINEESLKHLQSKNVEDPVPYADISAIDNDKKAELSKSKNSQQQAGMPDNMKTFKNFPPGVRNYPAIENNNIHSLDGIIGGELETGAKQKGLRTADEILDASDSNGDANENSQQFSVGYQNNNAPAAVVAAAAAPVGDNNEMNNLEPEEDVYGSENNARRTEKLDNGKGGGIYDNNNNWIDESSLDIFGNDNLETNDQNEQSKLAKPNEVYDSNIRQIPIYSLRRQKLFRRTNEKSSLDNIINTRSSGFPAYKKSASFSFHPKHKSKFHSSRNSKFTDHSSDRDDPEVVRILEDPNLSIQDKLGVMNSVIDPIRETASADKLLDRPDSDDLYIFNSIENTLDRMPVHILRDYPLDNSLNTQHLRKRSFKFNGGILCAGETDSKNMESPCKNGSKQKEAPCASGADNAEKTEPAGGPCSQGKCDKNSNAPVDEYDNRRSMRSVSDVWYTVFNTSAPLPFLTTRVRIFRKKANSWWRIAPSITLTSLSGIYANANLSILFSSHVEMFSLNKPLTLKDYKLIFPTDKEQKKSGKDGLIVDNCKYNLDSIDPQDSRATRSICEAASQELCPLSIDSMDPSDYIRRRKRENDDGVYAIGEFGYFPTDNNILEECPNDPDHLCLNILDTEAPAFRVKIQFPFRENAFLSEDYQSVRITNIINDSTTNGLLLVTVTAVNEHLRSHEFSVSIVNCPMTCGANTLVKRNMAPHVGEKFSFLLPMHESNPNAKYTCGVEVRNNAGQIIARRDMIVQSLFRCFCIWHCTCYCIPDLASDVVYNACFEMSKSKERDAGFAEPKPQHMRWRRIFRIALFFVFLIFLLGLLKAILGCCIYKIDKYGYDYVQPMHKHEYSSKRRRFFINSLFFLVVPFICCCRCFSPSDTQPVPSSDWGISFVQRQFDSDDFDLHSNDEETILSQHIEKQSQRKSGGLEMETPGSIDNYFCVLYNEEDEERDTNYVLNALEESRESLKLMDELHYSEELNSADPRSEEAIQLVRELIAAKIVYRTLDEPIGKAEVPEGQSYSIRGYFLPAAGPGYQFITHIPLRQHWNICSDINTLRPIIPPIMLFSKEFTRNYSSKMDVLEAGDLSVRPSVNAPCINVLVQDISMYHQPDPDDLNEEDQ